MTAKTNSRARYIMIGGFLGAGKTTAVLQLARRLTDQGLRVGLISNDQSTGLVDTTILRSRGYCVEEIAGGCFCCRFQSLLDATRALSEQSRPDVFIAEPVGSCTDLIATVTYPLRRIYGDDFTVAPLSVLVDPTRAARILGLDNGRSFSEKVVYVYRKQLEEADTIVVNKCDELDEELRIRLVAALRRSFPHAEVLSCSARDGTGLDPWFDRLMEAEHDRDSTMELDYEKYGEGEALLGWLNCTIELAASPPIDGNRLLLDLTEGLQRRLRNRVQEIAHLKMTLDVRDDVGSLSVVSLVGLDASPSVRETLLDPISAGTLIINLRAEGDPDELRRATTEVVENFTTSHPEITATFEHMESFRPGKPMPTHRMVAPA